MLSTCIIDVWGKIDGWKTYGVCLLAVVYAVSGALLGSHDWNHAVELIMGAIAGSGLRHALSKK